MNCASYFRSFGVSTKRSITVDTENPKAELNIPDSLLLAKEIHGSTPTQKQLKAAKQAAERRTTYNTTEVELLPVRDYYSISLMLRAALVLDSFSRGKCPNDLALSEFLSDSMFKIEILYESDGVAGQINESLVYFGSNAPFSCDFYYDSYIPYTNLFKLESPFKTRDICDMKTAARKLSDDIFNLHLGGISPQRGQGKTHYHYSHYLCEKYFELTALCDSNRIGVCGHCGNVFISEKTRGKQRLYCSDSCRVMEWKNTHPKPSDTPKA
jgi:hypothetical protein